MIRKLSILIWIFTWSIFAIDQISLTFNHMVSTNTIPETSAINKKSLNNSEIKPNKNQNKHFGKDSKALSESICFDEEFWSSVEAEITEDKRNFTYG